MTSEVISREKNYIPQLICTVIEIYRAEILKMKKKYIGPSLPGISKNQYQNLQFLKFFIFFKIVN